MGEADKFQVGQRVKHVSANGKGIGIVVAVKPSKFTGLMVQVQWQMCTSWYYEIELEVVS